MKILHTAITSLLILLTIHGSYAEEEVPTTNVGPVRGDNPNIGIKYDKNQGLYVTPFSAKLLGFKMVDVEERELFQTIVLQARIFDRTEKGDAIASAWLPMADAQNILAGTQVALERDFSGSVTEVAAKINGQAEVVLEIQDPASELKPGKFLEGEIKVKTDGEVVVVPTSSIIKSMEGVFAYVDNAGWTIRTEIELGAEDNGFTEIVDGIYPGDVVVATPVMTLWMTELQLLKSGKA